VKKWWTKSFLGFVAQLSMQSHMHESFPIVPSLNAFKPSWDREIEINAHYIFLFEKDKYNSVIIM